MSGLSGLAAPHRLVYADDLVEGGPVLPLRPDRAIVTKEGRLDNGDTRVFTVTTDAWVRKRSQSSSVGGSDGSGNLGRVPSSPAS